MTDALPAGPAAEFSGDSAMPAHVAIIMDGNGRWAKARGLPRSAGHERGVEALRRTVEAAGELNLKNLTVFSFSTENWRRPAAEVSTLFSLLRAYVRQDLKRLKREGVRVRVIGTQEKLPRDIRELVEQAEAETLHNSSFNLTLAFNYGGREELLRAAMKFSQAVAAGDIDPADAVEGDFARFLDTADLPDPDLLIRTSGERRLSNFLLWQCAYSEFVFPDVLWPDFNGNHLRAAIEEFCRRERRFGALASGTG